MHVCLGGKSLDMSAMFVLEIKEITEDGEIYLKIEPLTSLNITEKKSKSRS